MCHGVFVRRAHVDHHHLATPRLRHQGLAIHRRELARIRRHLIQRQAQFQQMFFRDLAQLHAKARHVGAGEPIVDELAFAPAGHQTRVAQRLEVRAGELDVDRQFHRQCVHRFFTLGKHLHQLQPLGAGQGFAYAGDLFVEQVFEFAVFHAYILTIIRIMVQPVFLFAYATGASSSCDRAKLLAVKPAP
ncbi:hypothetical protein FQZ97_996850 [compost metagenome]